VIRRASTGDLDAIAALYERSFATLTFLPVLHTYPELRAWLAGVLERDEVWLYEDDATILGFAALGADELDYLYLDPNFLRRGIGSALLQHAKARRPEGFTLWCFQQNAAARAFYERHGLEAVTFTDGAGNEEKKPDVCYAWRPA
jgi:GNAT superfamily N-acetyltransferase